MAAAALKPGLVLSGRFRLSRLLGRGAAGETWLGVDEVDKAAVALKFCDDDRAAREAEIGRRLVHPHIAASVEPFRGEAGTFLVRRCIDGESIGRLRNARLSTILASLTGIADALRHAHSTGVVHRDLKPSNVLCDASGFCWLTDFGAAREAGDARTGDAPAGSLPFMSPQQLDGAPAAPADDVYGFGALLYDLLSGTPLFHPGVSAERIRNETPALPTHTLSGEPVPASLTRLLGALLEKATQRRPPGMAAVALALEEIGHELQVADTGRGLIHPRSPKASATLPDSAPAGSAIPPRAGVPARAVYVIFAALVLAGIAFVTLLPRFVPRPSLASPPGPPAASLPRPSIPASRPASTGSAKDVDGALAELLRLQDELKKTAPERWAAPDWADLGSVVSEADAAYRRQDFAAARTGYERGTEIARTLRTRFPAVLRAQLDAGEAALSAGDRPRALAAFETASVMDPAGQPARRGLERAQRLDQLLAAMAQAVAAEKNGDRLKALENFKRAAAIDPQWKAADEGVRRLQQGVAEDAYRAAMSRGYMALSSRDHAAAQSAFDAALRIRPGDGPATSALDQVAGDRRMAELTGLREQALSLEQKEQWPDAVRRYEEALRVDPTGQPLLEGLARSRERAAISADLERVMADADRLNDDAVLRAAHAAVERGRAVRDAGPVLARQLADAALLIERAGIPVRVTFESDGVTEIVIYKVGKLGVFDSRTLDLRPGTYVAVGTRPGYRDVRRSFRVAGDMPPPVVKLQCEEPI